MCNQACLSFGYRNLGENEIRSKSVLEVGSRNMNGSLRSHVEAFGPASYLGVDVFPGPGVDEICDAEQLAERYGQDAFDLVISTEMLEHVCNWRQVIDNLKFVVRPGGVVLITTRSRGFPFHEAPYDFWRFEVSDMEAIFSDFEIENVESDPEEPGVFLKARKPRLYSAKDLSGYVLYSMTTGTHVHSVEPIKSQYEGKLIRREGNTPDDGKVYFVRQGRKQWVIDAGWISAHGFRWPEDVTVIPANELDEIPLGDPIHDSMG
jgi:SAM-dependent methyltransferase